MSEPLTPFFLRHAYSLGCFPMADDDGVIGWYEPRDRALFPIEGIRVSRTLAKKLKRVSVEWVDGPATNEGREFLVTFDRAFEDVMRGCLRPDGNWINEELIQAFTAVHREGWAHSCEVWQGERLVGGTYGLALGGCFAAESMFHRATDASKIALWAMVEQCRRLGFTIFDAEVMNPHLARLGAFEMPQGEYLKHLAEVSAHETRWSAGV